METLEQSRVCRLCGKQAGMGIDIFGKLGNHVKKINMVLPILVHEMDLLPKHMCHSCKYKLEEFYKFYENCLKTDANLKSQFPWMQRSGVREEIMVPMVQINNIKIKTEPFDYEEQTNTEAALNNAGVNFQENHYNFHEKLIQISESRCSRCGCYYGNRNYVNDAPSKNCRSDNIVKTHDDVKNIEYPSKDLIRRNLFATEIFDTKDSRVQPKIPIFDATKRFFDEQTPDEFHKLEKLDKLRVEKIAADAKPKMADLSSVVLSRTLRPRKDLKRLTSARSSIVSSKKSAKFASKKNFEASKDETKSDRPFIRVKMEPCHEIGRNLRPRKQAIHYSDSKRKDAAPSANKSKARINKIQIIPPVDLRKVKTKKEVDEKIGFTKDFHIDNPLSPRIFMLKLECEDYKKRIESLPNILKTNSNATEPFRPRIRNKISDVKQTTCNGDSINKIRSNVRASVSQKSTVKCPNDDSSERKNLRKNYPGSTLCLRIEKFDSAANKGNKVKRRKCSSRLSLDSSGNKKLRSSSKSSPMVAKYQDCNTCNERFASHELYRLHGCYNNTYHR